VRFGVGALARTEATQRHSETGRYRTLGTSEATVREAGRFPEKKMRVVRHTAMQRPPSRRFGNCTPVARAELDTLMPLFRIASSLALGLGVGITTAVAAPAVKPSGGARPVAECPKPNTTKCKSAGYSDTVCGRKHADLCMQLYYDAATTVPSIKMLRPNKTQIPRDLRDGKYFAYKPGPEVATMHASAKANSYRKAGDIMRKRTGMSMSKIAPVDLTASISPAAAAAYHREPAWDNNGDRVESCAEFAYERNYDVTRYIDAASACRGDRECVFDVTYMASSPGIASRTLKDTGGRTLPSLGLATGKKPKNDLFLFGKGFVRSNGTKAMVVTADVLALEAALETGEKYYEIGLCNGAGCNNTRKFKDEWAWHERLHDRTIDVSQSELDEYERRRAQFRALVSQWDAAVDREQSVLDQKAVQEIVLPYDMVTQNPWERFDRVLGYIEQSRDIRNQVKAKWGAGILNKSLEQAAQQVHGSKGGISPAAVLGMPSTSSSQASLWAPVQQADDSSPSFELSTRGGSLVPGLVGAAGAEMSQCLRPDGWGLEMAMKGPISCRIGAFMRAEWARKQAGQRSCLDIGNDHCDWTRDMIDHSILSKVPLLDKQLQDEGYCKAWQDGGTFPKDSVAAVQTILEKNEEDFKEIWPLVKQYDRGRGTHGQRFGKDWAGGDYLGDRGWFAAGYDYDVGWNVEPTAKDGAYVCELGGSIHAKTGFDAWIAGSDPIEVVDGSVTAQSNVDGSGNVRFKAHLEMFDQSLFSTGGWKVATTFGDPPTGSFLGVQLPEPKPRFDIYVGVPISGQLWGELLFGSELALGGKAGDCNKTSPQFAITASYTPHFGAYGVGQVGVGIAGVASAGIRAALTLVMLGLPVEVGMRAKTKGNQQVVSFESQVSLLLETLSGRVSLYVEFLMFDEEFELFRWKGIGPAKVPLMPKLTVDVPLSGMD
jgi:hypothetical protein